MINKIEFITAKRCRSIQSLHNLQKKNILTKSRLEKLNDLIKERVNSKYNFRSLPLNGTGFGRLTDDEKEYLIKLGYEIWEGHGGKCGTFDIIGW